MGDWFDERSTWTDPAGIWGDDRSNNTLRGIIDPGGLAIDRGLQGESFNPFDPGNVAGKEGGQGGSSNPYADVLAQISTRLFTQTDPLRTGLIDRSNQFLSGNLDVTQSPMYAALKAATDSQFGRARDNVIARSAPGGGLTSSLADLEQGRAVEMTRGIGGLAQGELDRSMSLATGLLPIGNSGLGNAANIQAQQMALQQQQQAAQKQGLGSAIGAIATVVAK